MISKIDVKKMKKKINKDSYKIHMAILGILALVIVIWILASSQQPSTSLPTYYYQPSWKNVEAFAIRGGERHIFDCPHSHWRIEWTTFQGASGNPEAILYCGVGLYPTMIGNLDRFPIDSFEEFYNLPSLGGYTLEITGNQGYWMFTIMAYY